MRAAGLLPATCACLFGWLGSCGAVSAHTLSTAHVDVAMPAGSGAGQVEVDLSVRDIALTLPLDTDRNEQVTWGELSAIRPSLDSLVREGLRIATARGACELSPATLAVRRYDDGAYAALSYRLRCPSSGRVTIDYHLFFDRDPGHRGIVTFSRPPATVTAIATPGASRIEVDGGRSHTFIEFLQEGVHHILIGYDHLAFLILLLLPAVLRRRAGEWEPIDGFTTALGHVLGIVTAFTLAHSITLTLAALGLVTPASRWVEAAIAASVLAAALNNLVPVVTRRVWALGFGFGLIHGFGFAGALGEIGLPKGASLVALLGFNVGVELGQLGVVACLLPLLALLRRRGLYAKWLMPAISAAIAFVALFWLFQRLAG